MENRDILQNAELIEHVTENGGPFLPVCLCLDTSKSMRQKASKNDGPNGPSRLETLQSGIVRFYNAVSRNPDACDTVNTAIVTFDSRTTLVENFHFMKNHTPPQLRLDRTEGTAMGPGMNLALDLIESYGETLKRNGVERYTPWLILMSDGLPSVGRVASRHAKERIQTLVRQNRLCVFPFGIGTESNLAELNEYSPEQEAFHLEGYQMAKLFDWLSLKAISVSTGETNGRTKIGLEKYEVESWAEGLR